MTIDTKQLRSDAEAVRASKSSSEAAYYYAARSLYADAPPEDIILALLDEVDRLRDALALAYPRAYAQRLEEAV